MASIAGLPEALQTLFTTTADQLARETGAVQRVRILSGSRLAQTLVLGLLSRPDATLRQLQQTLAATGPESCSRQALAQHLTEPTARFLQALLQDAAAQLFQSDPVAMPLLQRFSAVLLIDSTTISLPAALAAEWAGCGGSTALAGLASLKVQVRLDLVRGCLDTLQLQAGRAHDASGVVQTATVPPGALRLADLGYFALPVLAHIVAEAGHFLCRPKLQTRLYSGTGSPRTVADYLAHTRRGRVEQAVQLGLHVRLPCRLLAQRLPEAVAAQRLTRLQAEAQREGTRVSAEQRELCHWLVLVTSVPATQLRFAEAMTLYRLRWQVELLFKLWKSAGVSIAAVRTADPWRTLAFVYAKLLACLVQHWLLLACCWVYPDKSLVLAAQTIRQRSICLLDALQEGRTAIAAVIARLATIIAAGCVLAACWLAAATNRPPTTASCGSPSRP